MATKQQIFKVLAPYQVPIHRDFIAQELGESYRRFQTQLNRWTKLGLLEEKKHRYLLTQAGRLELAELENPPAEEDKEPLGPTYPDRVIQDAMAKATSFRLVIIQDDLNRLSEAEFKTVWGAIAKIIRSRGRKVVDLSPDDKLKTVE